MGCSMGKRLLGGQKYRALPVDDPSKLAEDRRMREEAAELERKHQEEMRREHLQEAAKFHAEASSASVKKDSGAPSGSGGFLDLLGGTSLPSDASVGYKALSSAVTNLVSGATDTGKAVLIDAHDQERGIFSDFAQGAPDELVIAGQGSAAVKGAPWESAAETESASRSSDFKRGLEYIKSLRDLPDDSPIKQGIGCFLRWCLKPLILVAMAYIWVLKKMYEVYLILPYNIIQMIFGAALCFYGGVYFVAIAAIEAAINLGGADMMLHLRICWDEGSRIAMASRVDDALDLNHDGVADVLQMSYGDLATRKAKVAMVAVSDPMRLQQAIYCLINVYIAVLATLKFQFAKTVAVALGIANMLTLPATRWIGPLLATVMGQDLLHWVPTIIDTTIKIIAVVVACSIQSFISAFYSALRGGKMFAEGFFNVCTERGWMEQLPDFLTSKPFDPDQSYLDEGIAYPLAAVGFFMQVSSGFSVPFPFSIVLLPLTLVEYVLRFQVYT